VKPPEEDEDDEDEAPTPARIASLMELSRKIAHRRALRAGMEYHEDELGNVAAEGLVKALARHDPAKGRLRPFAAAWMRDEVKKGIEKEQQRRLRELPLSDVEEVRAPHPMLAVEEGTASALDALIAVFVAEDLSSNGEARLLSAEAMAALHREIEGMEARDRQLVTLHYWEEKTWEEVGKALRIDDRTAQKWHARILEHLHERLLAWERVRPLSSVKKRRGP